MPITASTPIRTVSPSASVSTRSLPRSISPGGSLGTYIGFFRPRYAIIFVLAFAAFYTALAVLGSFTSTHLGMMLNDRVNRFHWVIAAVAWAVGLYALWQRRRTR